MNKKTYFYFDDVIWLFRDLTREKPKSIFDHYYLKIFKEAHEKYGMKVQMMQKSKSARQWQRKFLKNII